MTFVLTRAVLAFSCFVTCAAFANPTNDPGSRTCDHLLIGQTDVGVPAGRLGEALARQRQALTADSPRAGRDAAGRLDAAAAAVREHAGHLPPAAWLRARLGFDGTAYRAYQSARELEAKLRRDLARAEANRAGDLAAATARIKVSLRALGLGVVRASLSEPRPPWIDHSTATVVDHHVAADAWGVQALVEVRPPHGDFAYGVFIMVDAARGSAFVIHDPAVVTRAPFAYDVFRRGSVGDLRTLRIVEQSSVARRVRALGLDAVGVERLDAVDRLARRSFLARRQIDQVLTFAAKLPANSSLNGVLTSYFGYWARVAEADSARMLPSSFLLNVMTAGRPTQSRVTHAILTELQRNGEPESARVFAHLRRELRHAPPSGSRVDGNKAIEPWFIHYVRDDWSSADRIGSPTNVPADAPNYSELVRINGGIDFNGPAFARSEDPPRIHEVGEEFD